MIAVDSSPSDLHQALQRSESEIARLLKIIQLKDEQIRLLNFKIFGPKSEKLSPAQIPLLLQEISLMAGEVEQEAERPEAQKQVPLPPTSKPRPNHPGRDKLPEHLERREEILPCCPSDCRCAKCGAERPVIGYETREELACEPARFWVRVIKREKRGSHCEEEQGVATAAAPAQIIPKGKLSNEFIIEVLVRKYQLHLPVYRQCAALVEDYAIDLSRKTLTDAILAAGSLLRAVVGAQRLELLAGGYIQADETTMPCQTGEKTGRNHRAFVWEFSRPGAIVIFEFKMGRGREGPREFLQGFRGKLQSDGYPAYAQLGEGIVYVGCGTHIRRGFVDAAKVSPLDPVAPEILARFGELYAVEKEAREGRLSPEARLALRQADPQIRYLVGTPKGRLTKLEAELVKLPWQQARPAVRVKLLPKAKELYVFVESQDRLKKERAMRLRKLRALIKRLRELQHFKKPLTRDALLVAVGQAKEQAGRAFGLLDIQWPQEGQEVNATTFTFRLPLGRYRQWYRREGRYLLRTNLTETDAKVLWEYYLQLVAIEAAFRNLKDDLQIRPIFHQKEDRIEAHIFVAYLAYCLHVTLQARLRQVAGGLTPRSLLEKFATMQMMDVFFPTEEPGRELLFQRYTQPEKDHQMLLAQLGWQLPEQPPPKISVKGELLD